MASSSSAEIACLLAPIVTTATRRDHARMQPVTLTTPLDLPTITGQDARESVVDFCDDLRIFKTVSGFPDLDMLHRSLPSSPFLSWDNFVAAFRAEFVPVDYELPCPLGTRRWNTTAGRGPR
ncbi:hypothetical protein MTO96_017151 [Rhipicephalus appendiculatus]